MLGLIWCHVSKINADQHRSKSNTKSKMPDHSAALALEVGLQAGGLNKSTTLEGSEDSTYPIGSWKRFNTIHLYDVFKIVSYHLGLVIVHQYHFSHSFWWMPFRVPCLLLFWGHPPIDVAVGAHPKMASGFLWGNPHEEDLQRSWEKDQLSVWKRLISAFFFPPEIQISSCFPIYILPIPFSWCSQCHILSKRRCPGWTLMDAIVERKQMGSKARHLEGWVQCASHV